MKPNVRQRQGTHRIADHSVFVRSPAAQLVVVREPLAAGRLPTQLAVTTNVTLAEYLTLMTLFWSGWRTLPCFRSGLGSVVVVGQYPFQDQRP